MMKHEEFLRLELLAVPWEFELADAGDFGSGLRACRVERHEDDLSIRLTLHGQGRFEFLPDDRGLKGTRLEPKPLTCTSPVEGMIWGAFERGRHGTGDGTLTTDAECSAVEVTLNADPPTRVINWICNLKCPSAMFPRKTSWTERRILTMSRDGSPSATVELGPLSLPEALESSPDHAAIQLIVGQKTVDVRVGKSGSRDDLLGRGFVEYNCGDLAEEERSLILDALSFAFGRHLVLLGTTSFAQDWRPVKATAAAGQFLGRVSDFRNPSFLPCPLGDEVLAETALQGLVQGFLNAVSSGLDLQFPLWLTWAARAAPLDIQAATYGGALEALRRSYFQGRSPASTTIIEEAGGEQLRAALQKALEDAIGALPPRERPDADAHKMLRNKIEGLNERSSNKQWPEFFSVLGLPTGPGEKRAIDERNRPAHGHRYSQDDYSALTSKVYALHTLFNRVVLKLCGHAGDYIDYAVIGHPTRPLLEAIGETDSDLAEGSQSDSDRTINRAGEPPSRVG